MQWTPGLWKASLCHMTNIPTQNTTTLSSRRYGQTSRSNSVHLALIVLQVPQAKGFKHSTTHQVVVEHRTFLYAKTSYRAMNDGFLCDGTLSSDLLFMLKFAFRSHNTWNSSQRSNTFWEKMSMRSLRRCLFLLGFLGGHGRKFTKELGVCGQ